MLFGIDVGGTSTDGVLIQNGAMEKSVKKPRNSGGLTATILEVLDELLEGRDPADVRRLVISTTLVTNLLATQSGARTALLLIPGRGPVSYTHLDVYKRQDQSLHRDRPAACRSQSQVRTAGFTYDLQRQPGNGQDHGGPAPGLSLIHI